MPIVADMCGSPHPPHTPYLPPLPIPAQIITLVDLAGHAKYFKTTASGLTGHMPDVACLVVGANAGVIGMCKEHLGIALALQIPVFVVVTKVWEGGGVP